MTADDSYQLPGNVIPEKYTLSLTPDLETFAFQGEADIDHRSDLYSLGCVLFECLTGRPPFYASREQAVLRMHLEDAPPDIREIRKDVPAGLAVAIQKAVVRELDDRWRDAAHMKESLSVGVA